VLTLKAGGVAIEFTADKLLARPDAETIAVTRDPSYGQPMSYRGIPLRVPFSRHFRLISTDTIQARAADAFYRVYHSTRFSGSTSDRVRLPVEPPPRWPHLRLG
jgi:hypothetical protein